MTIRAYAAPAAGETLTPFEYDPGALGPFDVQIDVTHCGICHSDIHLIDNDWEISTYPLVPGHEIVGIVRAIGPDVSRVEVGQRVGVGWQCGSCLACEWCERGEETCCGQQQAVCVGRHGGFAGGLHVDGRFVYPLPDALESEAAAPLLCAGATVYTPLRRWVEPGARVGVIGIGGLGHLALQFAHAFGCDVTAFSTTASKESEARQFGAHHFVVSTDEGQMAAAAGTFDFILSTVMVKLDWGAWLTLLRPKGTLCFVGAAPGTIDIPASPLIIGQKTVCGSIIGDRSMIREMLAFAARHGVRPQTETLPLGEVNAAIDRVRRNEARYRVVLTMNGP